MAPKLVGISVSMIKVHWRQRCECAVVGDGDGDGDGDEGRGPGSPEVSIRICWGEASTDEGGSVRIILVRGADISGVGDDVVSET